VNLNELQDKLELDYPCNWSYKVIGEDIAKLESAIEKITHQRNANVKQTNKSKNGKYTTYNVQMLVHNEDDRHTLFDLFKEHCDIKIVL